ncbi:adenosine 5'-monophosphoramidase HINT3 isoform X2 [Halyomorpha halys]|uniref:adenosine 5'-monophosphoramidase HINT3 isoform X2 n=1 Tax=Halyomorpha halys TaxID=286706 RepID=UPI0006D51634|nr:histidine triad nucleotide-binding protein 3-like isoform X2 [Halyomorpha halys]
MVLRSIVLRALAMSAPECTPAQNCIFCTIVNENDQSKIVYQDDDVVAFPDIKPAAENHYLIIPRTHLPNAKDLDSSHRSLVEHMIKVGNDILTEKNVDLSNSRLGFHWPPFNTIAHLHLHAIAPVDKMSFVSKLIFRPDSYWFVSMVRLSAL